LPDTEAIRFSPCTGGLAQVLGCAALTDVKGRGVLVRFDKARPGAIVCVHMKSAPDAPACGAGITAGPDEA